MSAAPALSPARPVESILPADDELPSMSEEARALLLSSAQSFLKKGEEALRARKYDAAADALETALSTVVKARGEMHTENARFYHMYGLAMFELSSQNTDVFGEVVKEAIKRKAEKAASANDDKNDDDDDDDDDEDGDEGESEGGSEDDGEGNNESTAEGAKAEALDAGDAKPKTESETSAAEGADAKPATDDAAQEAGDDESASESGSESSASDDGEDGEAGDAKDAPDDPLEVAFECLDAARVLYERADPKPKSELSDVLIKLGDVYCEADQLDLALVEYSKASELRVAMEPRDLRAEAEAFQLMAMVNAMTGKRPEAATLYERAQQAMREFASTLGEAQAETRKEIEELIDELQGRIEDARAPGSGEPKSKTASLVEGAFGAPPAAFSFGAPSGGAGFSFGASSSTDAAEPVNTLSVKRRAAAASAAAATLTENEDSKRVKA